MRVRAFAVWSLSTFLLLIAACAPRHAPSLTETALRYNPVRIASNVLAKPGSMAWSPEGTRLAFIGKTLTIYDADSGEKKSLSIGRPYYVVWASDNTLYALSRDQNGKSVLSSVDMKNFRITTKAFDLDTQAVYPTFDGKKLIFLSANVKSLSYGTTIDYIALLHDRTTGQSKIVYTFSKTYGIKNPDIAFWTAWTHAGPSPLDDALVVMEHVKPPVFPFYTIVNAMDLATSEVSELSNPESRKAFISASWSPDGKRVVVTGGGQLEVRDRMGKSVVIDRSLPARYPSWNPRGSRIYAGGCLIDSDGKNKEMLLTNAGGSVAQWSADGTRLAVATGEDLLLFQNLRTSYVLPDKPLDKDTSGKLSLLKELLAEGVISPQEYHERRAAILMKSEEVK